MLLWSAPTYASQCELRCLRANARLSALLYYPLCVSRRIDTWQIVYLSNKDPCPKISINNYKSEIKDKVPYHRPLSRRLDRCDRVIQDEVGDSMYGGMDSDGNSQVSASTKWLTLAEPTYNWQLSMTVHVDINVP